MPERRSRLQSTALGSAVMMLLAFPCTYCLLLALHPRNHGLSALHAAILSLTFVLVVWALRAATPAAALCGGMISLILTFSTQASPNLLRSGLAPLMLLFILTFLASRAGRARKERAGLAESRRGRDAAQVIANLGAAGLIAGCSLLREDWRTPAMVLLLAALCEATADTVSSEIGLAFGGTPILLTTLRPAPPGTNGAVSLLGTTAGIASAALVAMTGLWAMQLSLREAAICLTAGVAGLFFDSLMGATVERRGWLNNDLVNFGSTLFAAAAAGALLSLSR